MASAVMGRLWIAERHLVLLCHASLHAPAEGYARALNQAVWREIGQVEVNEHVEAHKDAFMAAPGRVSPPSELISSRAGASGHWRLRSLGRPEAITKMSGMQRWRRRRLRPAAACVAGEGAD